MLLILQGSMYFKTSIELNSAILSNGYGHRSMIYRQKLSEFQIDDIWS